MVPDHPPEVLYGAWQRVLGNDELISLPVALQEQIHSVAASVSLAHSIVFLFFSIVIAAELQTKLESGRFI